MSLAVGIVGLPNSGKSTLFNALLGRQVADVAEYPFCTIEPNVGVVAVPDERLRKLSSAVEKAVGKPPKVVPSAVEFVDIAGLVEGAHKGEGLGNQFLHHIREVDAVLHLLRGFSSVKVPHPTGEIDPQSDKKIVETELMLKDLEIVENAIASLEKRRDQNTKDDKKILEKVKSGLEKGKTARSLGLSDEEVVKIQNLNLLTIKPIFYVVNGDSEASSKQQVARVGELEALSLNAKLESELSELSQAEQKEFREAEAALDRVIQRAYELLGLITFFTIKGGKQTQAWPIRKGSTALEAAGEVHSDFATGFASAEVLGLIKYIELGSWPNAKAKGLVRVEGRDYTVQDGDILEFRHH